MKGPRLDDSPCPLIDSLSFLSVFYTQCLHSIVFRLYFPYSFTSDCFLIYHIPRILIMDLLILNVPYVPFIFSPLISPAFGRAAYYLISCPRGLLDFDYFNWWCIAMLVSIFWWLYYDAKALCSYLSTFQYIFKVFKGTDSPEFPLPNSNIYPFSKFGYYLFPRVLNSPFFWIMEG